VLAASNVATLLSGEYLPDLPMSQARCGAGQHWRWDDIDFSLVYPDMRQARLGNNASCVLEIRAGDYSAVLTGDIELAAERQIVSTRRLRPASLVVVPHHGSRTSSHSAFIAQLQPRVAIISAGYENRWGFPKDDVVARWQAAGARIENTAIAGAISYRLCADSGLQMRAQHRIDNRRIWND